MKNNIRFWNRSICVYAIVLGVMIFLIDFSVLHHQQLSYKYGMFLKGRPGNDREAILFYDYLTKLQPANAHALTQLSLCYHRLGEEDKAVAAMSKAIALDPAIAGIR